MALFTHLSVLFLFCGMVMMPVHASMVHGADSHGQAMHQGQAIQEEALPARPMTRDMLSYGLELAELEQSYDRVLYQVLSQFFAPGSFGVDTRLEVQFHRPQPQSPPPAANAQNGLALPGMPLPTARSIATPSPQPGQAADRSHIRMELRRINVRVFADTMYKASDLAFMEQLVASAAKLEARRGDRIVMVPRAFPTKERPALVEVKTTYREEIDKETDTPRPVGRLTPLRRLDLPGIILVVSSLLLIFAVIYVAVVLRRKYA